MATMNLLDAMYMDAVGGFLKRIVSRCCDVPLRHWTSRCFSVSVTLSESLILLHASPDAASSLTSSDMLGGDLSNQSL